MNNVYGTLGLASASRNISIGESVLKDIRARRCKLVLVAKDASQNTIKKISDKCKFYQIDIAFVDDSETLSKAIGKYNIKAVAVLDAGFAKKIKMDLKGQVEIWQK